MHGVHLRYGLLYEQFIRFTVRRHAFLGIQEVWRRYRIAATGSIASRRMTKIEEARDKRTLYHLRAIQHWLYARQNPPRQYLVPFPELTTAAGRLVVALEGENGQAGVVTVVTVVTGCHI